MTHLNWLTNECVRQAEKKMQDKESFEVRLDSNIFSKAREKKGVTGRKSNGIRKEILVWECLPLPFNDLKSCRAGQEKKIPDLTHLLIMKCLFLLYSILFWRRRRKWVKKMLLSLPLQLKSLNFNDFYSCGHSRKTRKEMEEKKGEEVRLEKTSEKKTFGSWSTDIKARLKRNIRQAIPCLCQEDQTTTVYAKKNIATMILSLNNSYLLMFVVIVSKHWVRHKHLFREMRGLLYHFAVHDSSHFLCFLLSFLLLLHVYPSKLSPETRFRRIQQQ